MESCVVKSKEKKYRLKSRCSLNYKKIDFTDQNVHVVSKEDLKSKDTTISEIPERIYKENVLLQEHISEETVENYKKDIDTTSEFLISIDKVVDIDNSPNADLMLNDVYDQTSVEVTDIKNHISESKEPILNNQIIMNKELQLQNIYPNVKSILFCEQVHNIVCSQTIFMTHIDQFRMKIIRYANESFKNFIEIVIDIDKHPLSEMISQYQKAKYSCIRLRSRIKYLNSDLKRKEDALWKTIKKEVSTRGKCQDGITVNVSHTYIIKELNQDKFNELVESLKEIEESLSSDAFNFYLEELMRRRIENYLQKLISDDGMNKETFSVLLKKCISILFDCLRKHTPDKNFVDTCQKWLKSLISRLQQNGSFDDDIFILNHIIRCPNGIENWASQFIRVPSDKCSTENISTFGCVCQKYLIALYLILSPVPLKDTFLKDLKNSAQNSFDMNFTILDSDGEEEEVCEMFKNWSEQDIISLLKQIPIRSLCHHLMFDGTHNSVKPAVTEDEILKIFAFSSILIDILFMGMDAYFSEDFHKLFEYISNLVKDILSYVSMCWIYQSKFNNNLKVSVEAAYERFFFHVIFQVYKNINSWRILSALSYECISKKMLWNVMLIFYSPGKLEDKIYAMKDVERIIQDDSMQIQLLNHLREISPKDAFYLLNAFERIAVTSNAEEDFLKFIIQQIFQLTIVETSLRNNLSKEGCIILSSILASYPFLISAMLKNIDESNDDDAEHLIDLFKAMNFLEWIPEDNDISLISSWLISNSLSEAKSHLARLILSNLNWEFTNEGLLFLPQKLHKRIAILVTDAYLKFDSNCNEWLVSRGIKQILQYTALINQPRNEEGFVQWAWNILFSLKLHPLDGKFPPWIFIYDGCINKNDEFLNDDNSLKPLWSAFEKKHPSACYLTIVMTDVGYNIKNLIYSGLDCFNILVESEQYVVAIRSLYYILPFFVKNSEQLLEDFRFLSAMNKLMTADMTYKSNIFGESVIGAVLQNIACMIKYQIFQTSESTVECAAPLLKLWIKILMKILHYDKNPKGKLKYSAKQVYFLLEVLMKISYLHSYTRECTLDFLSTFCNMSVSPSPYHSFWKRFSSNPFSMCVILNRNVIPEYPWLAWFIILTETKQKCISNLWEKVQEEMVKADDSSVFDCLKSASDILKISQPPLDCLPIYRWAHQALEILPSHPISPLLWQQFFIYFFQRVQLPNSQCYGSIGIRYFKHGSCKDILERIKKHFSDAIMYYRNCVNLPGYLPPQKNQCDGSNQSASHLNILNLFDAFQYWIIDESLHSPKLCFAALEPKYCPNRLELILKGDQNIWFDTVSENNLKAELNQKFQSWNKRKSPNHISNPFSSKESLSKQLLRHLENYEDSKADYGYFSYLTISSVSEISYSTISSTDELLKFIVDNQSIIFEKAKYFSEQMTKMKQLNFNFINWIPQEYEIEDFKITEQKTCQKNSNNCAGAACFQLKIQKCTKSEHISERIFNNRKNFSVLQDQLLKFSVCDLCDASLLIENYIRSLSNRKSVARCEEAIHLQSIGVTLFYHLIESTEKIISSVAEYLPSRLFYSSIIESLGREFIEGHSSELQNLANCILNHPEAGSLALPLFNPNKSCISSFVLLYKTLSLSVGKYSPSVVLALLSKIDFCTWLETNSVTCDCLKEIINCIFHALLACDFNPCVEISPIFEILKKHFKIVLLHALPDFFLDIVIFLIKGFDKNCLSVDVYYETFFCFGCSLFNEKTTVKDIETDLKKFAQNQQLLPNQQMFISVPVLHLIQVKHSIKLFYQHFMEKRLSCNIYKNYLACIHPLGIFIAILSHSLVALELHEILTENTRVISDIWEDFHSPFWPWLHPVEKELCFTFPWTNSEVNSAEYMFKIFISCVKYFHEQLLRFGSTESVLSFLWKDYLQIYIYPRQRHYSTAICHSELLKLPWHEFHPSASDIEGMCKILQSNLIESKQFLSQISSKIPWSVVMKNISLTNSPEYVGKVLATLGKLFIIAHISSAETGANLSVNKFKEIETLNWHFLSVKDCEDLLNFYYSSFEVQHFLDKLENSPDIYILQFLRLVCSMIPNTSQEGYLNSKSVLYVQMFKSALCHCVLKNSYKLNSNEKIKKVLPSLLSDVDNIICNGVKPDIQMNCALLLMKEIITLFNTLPDGHLCAIALNSVTSWISMNTWSPLLLPCLKVSSCYLISVSHMVSLIESCISARFTSEVLDPCGTRNIWQLISSFLCIPSRFHAEFANECIKQNAFLALYSYVLIIMAQCDAVEHKRKLLKQMIQWVRDSNLSAHSEAKFLLLWDKILELSIALVLQDEGQLVTQELMSLCWRFGNLAEDRLNSGFFSAIGFGQISPLSINFRFLCRVMSAFILHQIPDGAVICIEQTPPKCLISDNENKKHLKSNEGSSPSLSALKALEILKGLHKKKLYAALEPQIDYALKCIIDSKYNFSESRKFLKYFAVVLFSKESYLSSLDF